MTPCQFFFTTPGSNVHFLFLKFFLLHFPSVPSANLIIQREFRQFLAKVASAKSKIGNKCSDKDVEKTTETEVQIRSRQLR